MRIGRKTPSEGSSCAAYLQGRPPGDWPGFVSARTQPLQEALREPG